MLNFKIYENMFSIVEFWSSILDTHFEIKSNIFLKDIICNIKKFQLLKYTTYNIENYHPL